jgi:hypothetical protein
MNAFFFIHRRGAEFAENIFSWSDFPSQEIRPNNLPAALNHKVRYLLLE